ncbi:MAG: type II toxin-antitoxin system HicB family antitoxin [Candidatus Paceibacterota bacterium]
MFNPFKKEVAQEALIAYKWRCPDKIEVSIKPSKDGGYFIYVNDLPGCVTQAETGKEIFEMVNDAIYTYLEIPENYQPYMPTFFPPKELREQLNIEIPEKYLNSSVVLQGT